MSGAVRDLIGRVAHPTHTRQLSRGTDSAVRAVCVLFALYHIVALSLWYAPIDLHSIVHLTVLVALTFVLRGRSANATGRLPVLDILLLVLCAVAGLVMLTNLDALMQRDLVITPLSPLQIAAGCLLLLLLMEAARRVVGLPFVFVIATFLLLMYAGPYLPGAWSHPGNSVTELVDLTVFSRLSGIWGTPLRMSATLIALFFIFGRLVQHSGLGILLSSVCRMAARGARGGPAKVAVITSGLVGSVTGGPGSNMAITGSFTIPMMKQAGYPAHFAGAIEAAASTGASIVPPVMTGVVFVMSELTGIPLVRIMLIALIPAALYYACLLLQVHFRAVRLNLGTLSGSSEDQRSATSLLADMGHLLIPAALLVVLLVGGMYPVTAVLWAIPAVPLAAALRRNTRMSLQSIASALAEAVQSLVWVAPVCALSGIVIVALFHTGLGSTFSHYVSIAAGQSQLLLIILGAAACLVLGTGVPPMAAYLMTVLIVAPLMASSGTPVVAAHMFALYYANLAFITPPIAVGAFIAAGLVGASYWKVSLAALRLAIVGFVVPAVFVYRPGLLLIGSPLEITWAIAASVVIAACLAAALEGWMVTRLSMPLRLLLLCAGLALVPPDVVVNLCGVAVAGGILLWQCMQARPSTGSRSVGRN